MLIALIFVRRVLGTPGSRVSALLLAVVYDSSVGFIEADERRS